MAWFLLLCFAAVIIPPVVGELVSIRREARELAASRSAILEQIRNL